jgi:glycosyltransferase involved in cell wall biosynthesis
MSYIYNGTPFVSIVTSTLNSQTTLARLLESVIQQKVPHWEHLIVDGGSSDQTLSIIESFAHDPRIKLVCSEADTGIYHAWNKAIPKLRGSWVLFLGSDDYLFDSYVFTRILDHITLGLDPQTKFLCTLVVDDMFSVLASPSDYESFRDWSPNWLDMIRGVFKLWPHPGILHHRSLFSSISKFDESYKVAADTKYVIANQIHRRSAFVAVRSVVYASGGISNCSGLNKLRFFEKARLLGEFGRPLSPFMFLYYLSSAFFADLFRQ